MLKNLLENKYIKYLITAFVSILALITYLLFLRKTKELNKKQKVKVKEFNNTNKEKVKEIKKIDNNSEQLINEIKEYSTQSDQILSEIRNTVDTTIEKINQNKLNNNISIKSTNDRLRKMLKKD